MEELSIEQIDNVNGGVVHVIGGFLIGWAAGKTLDFVVDKFIQNAYEFSENDFSASNGAFEPGSGFGTL